jgi:hypothetical protein
MPYQSGCHGRVVVGAMPADVQGRLDSLPGDWLEYEPGSRCIVVRHVQPTDDPVLPAVTAELVRMLSVIPFELQGRIEGGDLYVHVEEDGRLVRLRVEPRGTLRVQWARPDYEGAVRRAWTDGHDILIEPWNHRLNGRVSFRADDPESVVASLRETAASFEGLHPEGDLETDASMDDGAVAIRLRDVNLDARVLVDRLLALARPRTLEGRIDVSSFDEGAPERLVRLVFDRGEPWVQHPLLWS